MRVGVDGEGVVRVLGVVRVAAQRVAGGECVGGGGSRAEWRGWRD